MVERLPPGRGGMQVHVAELSRALIDTGVQQHVFARTGDQIDPAVAFTRIAPPPAARLHGLTGWCIAAARAVARQHARTPFDLIEVHGDMIEAATAARLGVHLGIPAVLTIHGSLSDVRWHDHIRLAAFSAMETVVVVSQTIAEQLSELGISSPVVVQPSGVRAEFFAAGQKRSLGAVGRPARILTVARLNPVKGIDTLIAVHDRLANAETAFTLVGGGEGGYADDLRAELVRRPAFTHIEYADAAHLAALMGESDVCLLPSRTLPGQAEGTPGVLLEAIAAGVPIVATDTGGVGALLRGGDFGELVAPDDPAGLAAAINRVIAAPEQAEERASAARGSGVAAPWRAVAARVHAVYEAATAHQRRGALFTLPQLDVGGAERFIIDRAAQVAATGRRVGLASAPGALSETVPPAVEQVRLARRGGRGANLEILLALAGALGRLRPEVVDSHHLPTGLLALAAARVAGIETRHVMTVHVPERPWSEPIIAVSGTLLFDRVLAVSDGVADRLRASVPTRFADHFVVTRAAVSVPPAVARRPQTAAVVARLVPRKGHEVLLKAWASVAPRAPDWTLEIWGDGPGRVSVEAAAAGRPDVRLLGEVADAAARLGELELVILPSVREGLPLALAEAMAAGVPVIASDLPGIRELVGDDGGVLVTPEDPEMLAAAILELIADPAERVALGARGRARVEDLHDPARVARLTLAALGLGAD